MAITNFTKFGLDPIVQIAPTIYRESAHQTTPLGVVIATAAAAEMQRFIREYAKFIGADDPYFRLDVYISDGQLIILEVNTCFVDGWGTALNLSRAAGIPVVIEALEFPSCFSWYGSDAYVPELELLVNELRERGHIGHHICGEFSERRAACHGQPSYVYGRVNGSPDIRPQNGYTHDDKSLLARFSRIWQGRYVTTPKHYTCPGTPWDDVPTDIVLKFSDKSSESSRRAGISVLAGKPPGKAKFLRNCYTDGLMVAQDRVPARRIQLRHEPFERSVQLVVLSNGQMLTGYTQYGLGDIINDNSTHGPLKFE